MGTMRLEEWLRRGIREGKRVRTGEKDNEAAGAWNKLSRIEYNLLVNHLSCLQRMVATFETWIGGSSSIGLRKVSLLYDKINSEDTPRYEERSFKNDIYSKGEDQHHSLKSKEGGGEGLCCTGSAYLQG